jgi:hypothetical protein
MIEGWRRVSLPNGRPGKGMNRILSLPGNLLPEEISFKMGDCFVGNESPPRNDRKKRRPADVIEKCIVILTPGAVEVKNDKIKITFYPVNLPSFNFQPNY